MDFRSRRTGEHYPLRQGEPIPEKKVGNIIADDPDLVAFEYSGSVYVEDGDGSRYTLTNADGSTQELEISDALDTSGPGPDEEEMEGKEFRNVEVVVDGAVDFFESYDNNDDESIAEIRDSLVKRYGKIAEDFLGITKSGFFDVAKADLSKAPTFGNPSITGGDTGGI